MKKLTPIALAVITSLTLFANATSVFAADTTATTPAASGGSSSNSDAMQTKFEDRKAKILKHISERLSKMQEMQSCVQSANDMKALHACKEMRPKDQDEDHNDK